MDYTVELREVTGQPAAVVRGHVTLPGISEFIADAFAEVTARVAEQDVHVAGPPFGRFRPHEDGFEVEVGFPTDAAFTAAGAATPDELPGGLVAQVMHRGGYDAVKDAYAAIELWEQEHGYESTGDAWETYLDSPDVEDPRTLVSAPCRPVAG